MESERKSWSLTRRGDRLIPARAGIVEVANQFALLGVDTNDGLAAALKQVSKVAEVEELLVAIGTVVGGEFLVIVAQGIAHLVQETSDGVGTDDDAEVDQRHGNLVGSAAGPLQASDGIAGGIVLEQELDQRDDVGGFFSTGLRPPPERRVRPFDTF